jgi:hypothetical protein
MEEASRDEARPEFSRTSGVEVGVQHGFVVGTTIARAVEMGT